MGTTAGGKGADEGVKAGRRALFSCGHAAGGLERCPNGLQVKHVVRAKKPLLAKAEDLAHGTDQACVERDAARKCHGRSHREPAHDCGLVAADHCVAESQEDVLDGHALLLPMDDVGLGEDGAAAGEARHVRGARDHVRVVLDAHAETTHLVFEERPRTRRAALVHCKLGSPARLEGREDGVLAANLDDGAGRRGEQLGASRDGGHVLEHRHAHPKLLERRRSVTRGADACAGTGAQLAGHATQQTPERCHGVPVMRLSCAPDERRVDAGRVHGRELHRACSHVDAEGVATRHGQPRPPRTRRSLNRRSRNRHATGPRARPCRPRTRQERRPCRAS